MKSWKLKDAGKGSFLMDPVAKWVGFGAIDDAGRVITVRVEDIALQRLDPTSQGADHSNVLAKHREKVFAVAAKKYELGRIDGDLITITDADIAQLG